MDLGIKDRVYIVTGGSRGLGLGCVSELLDQGAKVALIGRHEESVESAVAELNSENVFGYAADLGSSETAQHLVAAAIGRFGRLDGGVISVGGPPSTKPMDTSDEQWLAEFQSVFLGAIRVVRAIALSAHDHANGSETRDISIVSVLSTSVIRSIPGLSISNGLRPGLAAALSDLARELGPQGVRINGLLPGRFATDRVFTLDAQQGSPNDVRKKNEAQIPLQRYGDPAEFGRTAAFLLSPGSSYITGAMIPIDGGLTA